MTERNRAARSRQLSDSHEQLLELLQAWLGDIHEDVLLDLQNLASGAHDRENQTRYLRLRQDIQDHWTNYVQAFSKKFTEPLKQAASSFDQPESLADMQLLEEHELDEHIVLREFAARLTESCNQEIFALEQRVAVLLGREDKLSEDDNPLSPHHICRALSAAAASLKSIEESVALRPLLLRRLEQYLHTALPDIYHEINGALIKRGILPEIKRTLRRRSPTAATPGQASEGGGGTAEISNEVLATIQRLAAQQLAAGGSAANLDGVPSPPALKAPEFLDTLQQVQQIDWANQPTDVPAGTNLVWQVRHSEAAKQVGHLEAATIDIVAMLFDYIFDDASLPAGVKALVGRLQIPVLKVALMDQSFFSNRNHPARYFLDDISGLSLRWGGEALADDPFYIKLEELVTRIQQEFAEDVEIFSRAIDELEAFVDEREEEAKPALLAVASTIAQREEELSAAQAAQAAARAKAEAAVRPWLDAPIYPPIRDFFEEHWVRVLEKTALDPTCSARTWAETVDFMENLAWSISLKSRQQRIKLVALLPRLLKIINRGLDLIAIPPPDRQPFLDMLYELHTANVKAAMGSGPLPEPEARYLPVPENDAESHGELVVTRFVNEGVEVEEITLVGKMTTMQQEDIAAQAQVKALRRGDWIEFLPGSEPNFRATLKLISPQKGLLVFVRHRSRAAISISPDALTTQLRAGKAAIIEKDTLFERALTYVMDFLKRPAEGTDAPSPQR